jgi:creatinine amidohydrolase
VRDEDDEHREAAEEVEANVARRGRWHSIFPRRRRRAAASRPAHLLEQSMTIVDWAALKTTDFPSRAGEPTLAVLPLGATEQHGPHLPLGTDSSILAGVLDGLRGRALAEGHVLLLPLLPVGLSPEHRGYPGTLTVEAEHLLGLWCGIARSVAAAGVRRLLFLNSHGGNSALADVAAFRIRDELGMVAATLTTHRLGAPAGMLSSNETRYGIHGGQAETALMRALEPGAAASEAAAFASKEATHATPLTGYTAGAVRVAWRAEDLNPAGTVGDAAAATASDGERLLAFYVDRICVALGEVLRLPLPTAVSR